MAPATTSGDDPQFASQVYSSVPRLTVIAIDWVVLEDSRGNQMDQVKFDVEFQLDLA